MTARLHFSMIYGLILGLAIKLMEFIFSLLSFDGELAGLFSYLLIGVLFYLFFKHYRDKVNDGELRYTDCLRMGFMIGVAAGLICGLIVLLRYKYGDGLEIKQLDAFVLAQPNLSDVEKQQQMELSHTPMAIVGLITFSIALVAFFISLVLGLVLRKEKTIFENNN